MLYRRTSDQKTTSLMSSDWVNSLVKESRSLPRSSSVPLELNRLSKSNPRSRLLSWSSNEPSPLGGGAGLIWCVSPRSPKRLLRSSSPKSPRPPRPPKSKSPPPPPSGFVLVSGTSWGCEAGWWPSPLTRSAKSSPRSRSMLAASSGTSSAGMTLFSLFPWLLSTVSKGGRSWWKFDKSWNEWHCQWIWHWWDC